MEITYLKKIQENPTINKFTNRGFTIEKIQEIEEHYNNEKAFPKAFREFLFLAGDFNNFGFDDIDELQKIAQNELEITNQTVDRPFFTFSVYDSQYSVVFLDEDKPDPDVYLISPYAAAEGEELIKPNGWIFSKLVNESIRRVKNNIPF